MQAAAPSRDRGAPKRKSRGQDHASHSESPHDPRLRSHSSRLTVRLLEGKDPEGSLWTVSVLPEGPSENTHGGFPIYYPGGLLERAAPRLEGAPAYIYQLGEAGFDHFPRPYRDDQGSFLANLIGWYRKPRVEERDGKRTLVADLYIHRGAKSVRRFLKDAWAAGVRLGISIVADGAARIREHLGRTYAWMEELFFASADPVSRPATDARFLALLESDSRFNAQSPRSEVQGPTSEIHEPTKFRCRTSEVARPYWKGGPMKTVSHYLLELAERQAPDLIKGGQTGGKVLSPEEAIALATGLVETLDADAFPEATLRKRLGRVREAIEAEDLASAKNQLEAILLVESSDPSPTSDVPGPASETVEESDRRAKTSEVDESATERDGAGDDREDVTHRAAEAAENREDPRYSRLQAHFGEEAAQTLVDALGDRALACLPAEAEAERDGAAPKGKLRELLELIQQGRTQDAITLLEEILGAPRSPYPGPQGSPYPTPVPQGVKQVAAMAEEGKPDGAHSKDTDPAPVTEPAGSSEEEEVSGGRHPHQDKDQEAQGSPPGAEDARIEDLERKLGLRETREVLESLIAAEDPPLPPVIADRLWAEFAQVVSTEAEIGEAIARERAYAEALAKESQEGPRSPEERRLARATAEVTGRLENLAKAQEERMKEMEAELADLKRKEKRVSLQEAFEERLRRQLLDGEAVDEPDEAQIAEALKSENEFVDALLGSMASQVTGMGTSVSAVSVEESQQVMEGWFDRVFGIESDGEE